MDLEITPEPTEAERRAIVAALREEAEEAEGAAALPAASDLGDPYATAPPRQRRGATRA